MNLGEVLFTVAGFRLLTFHIISDPLLDKLCLKVLIDSHMDYFSISEDPIKWELDVVFLLVWRMMWWNNTFIKIKIHLRGWILYLQNKPPLQNIIFQVEIIFSGFNLEVHKWGTCSFHSFIILQEVNFGKHSYPHFFIAF